MAINFDDVDVKDFGHALNDNVTGPALEQAVTNLASACSRAERDQQYREVVLRREGIGLDTDTEWGRLMAKAKRLDALRYALGQKLIMDRAKARSGINGPFVYQVTEAECEQKKSAADAALADWRAASKNAVEVGVSLPDVEAYVRELGRQVAKADCHYKLADKQLARNGLRDDLVVRYEQLMASARLICGAGTEGERRLLGVRMLNDKEAFEEAAAAFNGASQEVTEAKDRLEAVLAYQGAKPVDVSSSASARSSTADLTGSSSSSSDSRVSSSATRLTPRDTAQGRADYNLERRPSFASSGMGRVDYRQSTSSARQQFEALLASVYGATYTAEGTPATVTVLQGTSASRLTTTTTSTTQRIGPWTVTETSVVQASFLKGFRAVHEQYQAVMLRQLTMSWETVFGGVRAECQQMSLEECIADGDHDGNNESIVLHACLVRPEVTAMHIRLLMRYLGYPTVAWVKRGHSYRRGPREDCAWIKFGTLDEARDCKWRWDGMGHWGLTPWDDWNNIPRPLHFSFSTHPDYKDLKE